MVGNFHQDISETTLPKIKLKEKGIRQTKNEKISYIKPVSNSNKISKNLTTMAQVKEQDNIYPYLKDNSLFNAATNQKKKKKKRKKSNLSDY